MPNAILLNIKSDINSSKTFSSSKSSYYSRNICIDNDLIKKNLSFEKFQKINSSESYDFIVWLALNWYRDEKGRDLSIRGSVSLGNILARRLMTAFANDYRNYFFLKEILKENRKVYASNAETLSFKRVSKIFKDNILFYGDQYNSNTLFNPDPEFTNFYEFPKIHKLSKLARFVQKPFFSRVKKRPIMNIKDWSTTDQWQKRSDCLNLNSFFPWKGYYFNNPNCDQKELDYHFPGEINKDIFNIEKLIDNIPNIWDKPEVDLINHFFTLVKNEYSKGRNLFKRTYSIFKETIEYYQPKSIIIPGETHFAYIILNQIAKEKKIKTILAIDGYQFVRDVSIFYKDSRNEKSIFDKILVYSLQHKSILASMGLDNESFIECKFPLLEKQKKNDKEKVKYDAIIMSYQPNQHNPRSVTWDKRGLIVVDVIKVLIESGCKEIGLKVKNGQNDIKYYSKILEIFPFNIKIDILVKPTHNYVYKTKLVVGQFSTALFEFSYNNVPYYVFEPEENGKTDDMINSASIFNRQSISRSTDELKSQLKNNTHSVILDRDILHNYNDLLSIKTESFIALND